MNKHSENECRVLLVNIRSNGYLNHPGKSRRESSLLSRGSCYLAAEEDHAGVFIIEWKENAVR